MSLRPIVGFMVGLVATVVAIVLYYASPVHVGQLWIGGFHIHHLYYGVAIALLSLPAWLKNHRVLALFLLGVGLAVTADGLRLALM